MADSQGFLGRPSRMQGKVVPTAEAANQGQAREAYGLGRISAKDKVESKSSLQSALNSHKLDLKSIRSDEEEKRAANMMQNPHLLL